MMGEADISIELKEKIFDNKNENILGWNLISASGDIIIPSLNLVRKLFFGVGI